MSSETKTASRLNGKYLTFNLHSESYGIDVLKVREIIRLTTITAVPQMPAHIRGVINLRGKIIPVMDLRIRFEFASAAKTEHTCIIVVQVKLPDGKTTQMGLVVDGVEEVINITCAASRPKARWHRKSRSKTNGRRNTSSIAMSS